ncbi:MAG TPA: GNAT family N-acetyltransferase [Steroidobacteraceae bacterium]
MNDRSAGTLPGHVRIAPRLETDRLILRPHRVEDFPDCAAMWRDPQVVKYTIGAESPPQRTWQRLLAYCGHWALLGFGYWAVESKSSGRYIGELGFADFHRDLPDSVQSLPEIGWALAVEAHGQGYATEALRKVLAWGDANLAAPRTICIIQRENLASVHLARKFGYSTTLREATDSEPVMLLARPAPAA